MSTRFRGGAQSGSHRSVSTPCPPNRTCGFPASGSLQWDHASRTRNAGSEPHSRYRWLCVPPAPRSCTASPALPLAPTRRQACSRPDGTEPPSQPGPFAYACDALGLSAPSRGVRRQSHSRGLSSLRHPSTPEAPFLDGHYPASSVLRASPPPCRPGLPSRGSGCPRARHRQGSRVATLSIFHACRRHYPGGNRPVHSSLSSRPVGGLPLFPGGSTSAITVSRPARRSLAFRPAWSLSRPRRPFSPESFNPCRCLHEPPWPLPAGTTVAGWGSHPPGKRAFPRRTGNFGLQGGNSALQGYIAWYDPLRTRGGGP